MASDAEVVYDLLGISVSENVGINVYFQDEIIHLEKSGNYLSTKHRISFGKEAINFSY